VFLLHLPIKVSHGKVIINHKFISLNQTILIGCHVALLHSAQSSPLDTTLSQISTVNILTNCFLL